MKNTLLCLLLFFCADVGRAANTAEGVVYLKDGTTVEVTGRDRIRLPRGRKELTILHDAFGRKPPKNSQAPNSRKEKIAFGRIDSVVCWHAQSPEHRRKLLPTADRGWLWLYFETPTIRVVIRSGKGYEIASNGGIRFVQRKNILCRAGVEYCADKPTDRQTGFERLGPVDRRTTGRFRNRLARYVADDPAAAERILRSSTSRSKTVLLLRNYKYTEL